ncbi:unnamed protein product [Brachionus calyciflorus]|uniref:Homeobox domain-containing protein n=1 Tax=Brachionus calyciflorus TaxID=104777 RepID=A0A813VY55_9BILA|nr:unnamed protein product [Brachionus calyciflorus]
MINNCEIFCNVKNESKKRKSKSNRRYRTSFEPRQLSTLEKVFEKTHYPDTYIREEIAEQTGLTEEKVQIWFQNRRAKFRRNEKFSSNQKESNTISKTKQSKGDLTIQSLMNNRSSIKYFSSDSTNISDKKINKNSTETQGDNQNFIEQQVAMNNFNVMNQFSESNCIPNYNYCENSCNQFQNYSTYSKNFIQNQNSEIVDLVNTLKYDYMTNSNYVKNENIFYPYTAYSYMENCYNFQNRTDNKENYNCTNYCDKNQNCFYNELEDVDFLALPDSIVDFSQDNSNLTDLGSDLSAINDLF